MSETKRDLNKAFVTEKNSSNLLTLDHAQQDHDFLSDMSCRTRLAYESEALWWGVVILLLVIVDFIMWVVELVDEHSTVEGALVTTRVSLTVATLLCVEWLVRLYAFGPSKFCRQWLPWLDFVVSFGGLILVSFALHVLLTKQQTNATARYLAAINLARLVRVFRLCFIFGSQRYKVINATRRLVSQNRRRFKDEEFDLDLTYVTDGIIAMSLPAHKQKDRLYRNNIDDVERFFQQRHDNHYRIYNVTSERRYGIRRFQGNVMTVDIDDHNPAPLIQLKEMCTSIDTYLKQDAANVAAVHCKGGKGRTGTAICCYLLHSRALDTATDALAYFASRRTDHARGNTYQGVQTPSQARYISYYDRMLRDDTVAEAVRAPPTYILESVTMQHLGKKVPNSAVFDLVVYDGMRAVRLKKVPKNMGEGGGNGDSKESKNSKDNSKDNNKCVPVHPIANVKGVLTTMSSGGVDNEVHEFNFGGVLVRGDVKCRMLSSFKLPGKKYDESFMYFWFHTAFLNKDHGPNNKSRAETGRSRGTHSRNSSNLSARSRGSTVQSAVDIDNTILLGPDGKVVLHLDRNHLDNGHHSKNQKVLSEEFCIDLKFRLATAKEIMEAGEYVVQHFEDELVGGVGTGTGSDGMDGGGGGGGGGGGRSSSEIVNVVVDDQGIEDRPSTLELLNAESPWSRN